MILIGADKLISQIFSMGLVWQANILLDKIILQKLDEVYENFLTAIFQTEIPSRQNKFSLTHI